MSQPRPIWNDGQGLSTPDLQRGEDLVGAVDDRVYEVMFTPGPVQKRIIPLSEESSTVNPHLLAVPSAVGLTPAGVNGAVRLMPSELIAGSPSSVQQISLSASLYAPLDTAAITSNSSGGNRYDLIYATVNRAVSTTGTRKIKSATDGTLSSQTVNLADAPAVTLGVNVGFLTGATPPTAAQIAAATPADTAPSSSTFGSFNFPIAYVTVANGYTSGTVLFQDSSGGTTFITQCWNGGFVKGTRVRQARVGGVFYGTANEKFSTSVLTKGTRYAERWGSTSGSVFLMFKLLTSTPTIASSSILIDDTIDWRQRLVWGWYGYLGAGNITLESTATFGSSPPTVSGANLYNPGIIPAAWTGPGINNLTVVGGSYNNAAGYGFNLVFRTDGTLGVVRSSNLVDGANGDLIALQLFASDPLKLNG